MSDLAVGGDDVCNLDDAPVSMLRGRHNRKLSQKSMIGRIEPRVLRDLMIENNRCRSRKEDLLHKF